MYLKNFPNKSQLADINEKNMQFDCVPTCIADALSYLTGRDYNAATIKDLVYGPAYVGGTSADAYIDYCAAQNVHLFAIKGDGPALVKAIRTQLAQGVASIGTEADPYADPTLGWSHAIIFYGMDEPAGTLTARDPYSTQDVVLSDAVWASMLEFSEVWPIAPLHPQENIPPMSTLDRLQAAGWKDDGQKLTAPNGIAMVKGFRLAVINATYYDPADWPLELEHGADQMEVSNPAIEPGTQQTCRMTIWEWNTKRGVFRMWTGQEILALRKLVQQHEIAPTLPISIYNDLHDAAQRVDHAVDSLHDAITRHA